MVQNVFRSGLLLRDINRTFMVLIPKVTGVTEVKHLRSISLCNTTYKIIAKILANRLKQVIKKIISPSQSVFVPRRWIGENAILANEVLHSMNRKKGMKGIIGIKVDMQKAYDRVDWVMISRILILFGFSDKVAKLVLNCISSISMELLLNGSIFDKIPMERGLWQGDPLSPFLFILMAKLLSRMLFKWEIDRKITGMKFGCSSPSVTHLLFGDDVIIFCGANTEEACNIHRCLQLYWKWTGQSFNRENSECFFSRNVSSKGKSDIKKILGRKELEKNTKHLRLPLFLLKNKSETFQHLQRKVETRIQGWKAKLLSQAGRATLIKHMVTSIPVYTMSTFLLPKGWCQRIQSKARAFLWTNDTSNMRGFNPIAWRKVCQSKFNGGLGIKHLWNFNKALIAKIGWCLATDDQALWVQALKAKYFPHSSFMKCKKKNHCSWLWSGVLRLEIF
ncbi:uncharacterized protein LOC125418867 [Ziziphus jujuba]|uniref:Uncharacterized protein LOC125418867 n=1 Tax=Ziziphus jujuba TaxID=326968 RepID=A0ABM3I2X2_ZIZJJ|nr:uncharacterized protein LOC125418867 [Ziziphus jujuba]